MKSYPREPFGQALSGELGRNTDEKNGGIIMEEEVIREESQVKSIKEQSLDVPEILEEITMDEMAVDGICGIY